MAIVDGKFVKKDDDWVVMQTGSAKDFIRVRRYTVDRMLSEGWKLAVDVYREKFQEREAMSAELTEEMAEIKRQINELERKK